MHSPQMLLNNTILMATTMVTKSLVMLEIHALLSLVILRSIDMAAWTLTVMVGPMKEMTFLMTLQNIWIQMETKSLTMLMHSHMTLHSKVMAMAMDLATIKMET